VSVAKLVVKIPSRKVGTEIWSLYVYKLIQAVYILAVYTYTASIRGAIKKFSAWPSSVQNKIKILFASYSSKAQNSTCTMWLLGCKYFVHFSDRRLSAFDMEENGVTQCNKMTILIDSFIPLHALLFWLRNEVVDARFILNNELRNEILLGHVGIIWEVLQKLV